MKELKIKILNEEHSKKVQECFFALNFTWGALDSDIRDISNGNISTGARYIHHNSVCATTKDETTLEELQQMVQEKNGTKETGKTISENNKGEIKRDLDLDFLEDVIANESCIITMAVDSMLQMAGVDSDVSRKLNIIKKAAEKSIMAVISRRDNE